MQDNKAAHAMLTVALYNGRLNTITYQPPRYRAFSLPGQFVPRSESAIRTLADSLPGPFVPWPFCSLELSLCGPFAPDGQNHYLL